MNTTKTAQERLANETIERYLSKAKAFLSREESLRDEMDNTDLGILAITLGITMQHLKMFSPEQQNADARVYGYESCEALERAYHAAIDYYSPKFRGAPISKAINPFK